MKKDKLDKFMLPAILPGLFCRKSVIWNPEYYLNLYLLVLWEILHDCSTPQARLYHDESLRIGSLISSQVSVELKRARSLVRVEEIQSTLQEQRYETPTVLSSYMSHLTEVPHTCHCAV